MKQAVQHLYEFGPFRIDPDERLLMRSGESIPLTAKAFDTLLILVRRSGHLVEKSELISAVWANSFVEEGNLTVVICTLRKALGDENSERKYIQTVAKRGYRFVGEVREVVGTEPERPTETLILDGLSAVSRPQFVPPQAQPRPRSSAAKVVLYSLLGAAAVLGAGLYLRRTPVGDGVAIKSIAVLPFQALNPNSIPDYLPVGMADAVITRLGNTGQIIVRPTSTMQKYVHVAADPVAVGKEQKVDAILEGNIELQPDWVSVRVQLVRVRDGTLLWADVFKERPEQMFLLEEEVAERIVQSAPFRISQPAKMRLARADTTNPKAYQSYLEGRYLLNKRTERTVRQSVDSFKQAIANDPRYALAYSGLADAYVLLGTYGEPPWQLYPSAKSAMLKALELDDTLANAHASRAMISFHYEWNWADAEQEFQRAIALNPNDPMVRAWYAMYLGAMGRRDEALREAEEARQLDPLSPVVGLVSSRILYWNHEYDRAIAGYSKIIELDPQFTSAHTRLGMTYLAKRALPDAVREFEEAEKLSGPNPYTEGLLGYAEALSGNVAKAHQVIQKLTERSHHEYVPALSIAFIYISLGEREHALEWLSYSYQDRSTHMVYAKVDPLLDPMRSDPRFNALLHQMGLL
jgi:DNA-binding winged helix-turn-helix (wHTH) protein/TolB-like protein/tetratricopeptide (TPR) repeat protein